MVDKRISGAKSRGTRAAQGCGLSLAPAFVYSALIPRAGHPVEERRRLSSAWHGMDGSRYWFLVLSRDTSTCFSTYRLGINDSPAPLCYMLIRR